MTQRRFSDVRVTRADGSVEFRPAYSSATVSTIVGSGKRNRGGAANELEAQKLVSARRAHPSRPRSSEPDATTRMRELWGMTE